MENLKNKEQNSEFALIIKRFLSDNNFKNSFFDSEQILYCFMGCDFIMHKISPSSLKVLGYKPEELEGESVTKIADKEMFIDNLPMYDYMIKNKSKPLSYHPAEYISKEGEKIKFQCLDPIYIEKGDMWMLRAYQIEHDSEGITVLTDDFKEYVKRKS